MITTLQVAQACGCSMQRAAAWRDVLIDAMGVYAITRPERVAAFLAQVAHESGRLQFVRELWGPTPAQEGYERDPAAPWALHVNGQRHRNSKPFELGNAVKGDGSRYRGRGLIQITGRANAAAATKGLQAVVADVPNLEADPAQMEQPRWAALTAAWFWHSRGLNELADARAYMQITRRINGGTNGYADRVALWEGARAALGLGLGVAA
jgi:putative chitinase